MPLKKKKVLGRPLYQVPVRDRAALEIVKGKADECLTPSPGAWVAPKVRQSLDYRPVPAPLRATRRSGPPRAALARPEGRGDLPHPGGVGAWPAGPCREIPGRNRRG